MRTRFAALAALIAVAATTFSLVTGSGGSPTTARTAPTAPVNRSRHRFWVVRAGQTLSLISARTGVSAATIKSLNPRHDLAVLHSGDKVRVRP